VNSISLFDFPVGLPLAARMRPERFTQIIGQDHLAAPDGPLSSYLSRESVLPSLILYGPPGTGKTTLARVLAAEVARKFIEISAINATIADLREAFRVSADEVTNGREPAVVFIDEIHRFSKVQQESTLKAVEEGLITLIGATTENPLFSLTSGLLSRCTLLTLNTLETGDLVRILQNALDDERGLAGRFSCDETLLSRIAELSVGDARKGLTILESLSVSAANSGSSQLSPQSLKLVMPVALNRYDAGGDQHYDIISAFIKSIRGSDPDAALHYLARMIVGGEDPRFIARRLVILAAEDIGLADPQAITLANSVMQVVAQIGMPEGRIPLAEATIYLALAPKSNSAYKAINSAIADVESGFTPDLPLYLRSNSPEKGPEAYIYPHDVDGLVAGQRYLSAETREYFEPNGRGQEQHLAEVLQRLKVRRTELGL